MEDSSFASYKMRPEKEFTILVGEEKYYPENVTVLEVENWDEEHWLSARNFRLYRAR